MYLNFNTPKVSNFFNFYTMKFYFENLIPQSAKNLDVNFVQECLHREVNEKLFSYQISVFRVWGKGGTKSGHKFHNRFPGYQGLKRVKV